MPEIPESHNESNESLSPREKVEQMQAAFDVELEHVLEELQVWNFRLATAYAEDEQTGENTHLQLAHEAKKELDAQWSYYEDWVMVSGTWDVNRPYRRDNTVMNDVSMNESVFTPVPSNGFEVDFPEDAPPVVGFSFKIGIVPLSNRHLYGSIEALAFAKPEMATFSLARRSTELVASKEALVEAVHFYDGLLNLYTQQPSDFYRKSAQVQQKFFEKLIDDLTETITVPSYVTLCQYAEVPYMYRRGVDEIPIGTGLTLEYIKEDTDILLSGRIKGVTILDSLFATDEPLRSKDDLLDPDAGICFVVSVTEGSLEDGRIDERDFIVPSRLIKDLDLVIK